MNGTGKEKKTKKKSLRKADLVREAAQQEWVG